MKTLLRRGGGGGGGTTIPYFGSLDAILHEKVESTAFRLSCYQPCTMQRR